MISRYHRPASLEEVFDLLARDGVESVLMAGGTVVNATEYPDIEVIDLQNVCPDAIAESGDRLVIGAMARLQDVVDHAGVPPLLRELAHREGPNTLRHSATIGGTVASADWESELLAGLLVHEATAEVRRREGSLTIRIADLFADPAALSGGIIASTSVEVGGATASARTGRTPADTSIVAAIGRVTPDGLLLALTGIASTPVLITRDAVEALVPPADFRGSSDYRRNLARVLADRVVDQLGGVV
jgi:CO/xanthine dehydrogenase FAD-binding subunit